MTIQETISAASAMKIPIESPCRSGGPQKTGSFAPSAMSFDTGIDGCVEFCSGPCCPKSHSPTHTAIQFSMIVVITSWAPTVALRMPAMPANMAPASEPATRQNTMCRNGSRCTNDVPIHTAKYEPTRYWPWPPMLKRPHRNAKARASAEQMIGVVISRVCWRFDAAIDDVFHQNQTWFDVNGT